MARRKRAQKRTVLPDPVYNSKKVTKFINRIMRGGKRSKAERIFYSSMDLIEERTGKPGIDVFNKAIKNTKPSLEVRSRRVGGATYQVPMEIREERKQTLAYRWIISFSHKRSEKKMYERLCNEMMEAANSEGASVRKKEEMHRMAEANKAFAHFNW